MKNIKSGIYRITNPINQVYIGQSVNLYQRIRTYKGVKNTFSQPKIHSSLKQYGAEAHQYDILEVCDCVELDAKEAEYKQQFINANGWDKALFCWLNDPPTSEERRARQKPKVKVIKPKFGKPKKVYHTIYQYDVDGKFIREWGNDKLHSIELVLRATMLQCARGDLKVAFAYQWEEKRYDEIKPYKNNYRKSGVSKYKHLFD